MGAWAAPGMHPHIPCLGHAVGQLVILLVVAPNQHLGKQHRSMSYRVRPENSAAWFTAQLFRLLTGFKLCCLGCQEHVFQKLLKAACSIISRDLE